ncbi:MAG: YIP1 family protein [Acidobacteriota bacterium]
MTETEQQNPSGVPEPASAFGRLVGTFFSPGATFRSIAAKPGFLAPLIVWTLVSLGLYAAMAPKFDYEKMIRQSIEKKGQTVPEDRIQSIVATQKKIAPIIGTCISLIAPTVVTLIVALVLWASFKAFGWDVRFKQAVGATAHSYLPSVLGALLLIPVVMQRESVDPQAVGDLLRSNLGFLVEKTSSPALHSLLGSLDVFSIWTLILLSIGFAAAGRTSRKAAGGVVFTLWALFVLGKAGLSALLG